MKTARLLAFGVLAGLLALLWATPAGAQDEPTITADPATVEEPGSYDVSITGSGFVADEIAGGICPGAEGDPEAVTAENLLTLCDVASIQTDDNTDGEVTLSFTGIDIPEQGMVFIAGDIVTQAEFAFTVVTIGAGDDGAADDGETDDGEELPETGSDTGPIAIVGAAVLVSGIMMVGFGRRLGRL